MQRGHERPCCANSELSHVLCFSFAKLQGAGRDISEDTCLAIYNPRRVTPTFFSSSDINLSLLLKAKHCPRGKRRGGDGAIIFFPSFGGVIENVGPFRRGTDLYNGHALRGKKRESILSVTVNMADRTR